MSRATPEGALLRLVLDWLAAERVLAFRMNTGAVVTETRFFRFGVPGMADVLAFPAGRPVTWLELKARRNGQSEMQKSFQAQVQAEGHLYLVIRDLSELEAAW